MASFRSGKSSYTATSNFGRNLGFRTFVVEVADFHSSVLVQSIRPMPLGRSSGAPPCQCMFSSVHRLQEHNTALNNAGERKA